MSTLNKLVRALVIFVLLAAALYYDSTFRLPKPPPPTAEQIAAKQVEQAAKDKRQAENAAWYKQLRTDMGKIIRAAGYSCVWADAVRPHIFDIHGYTVGCNAEQHSYEVHDRGGRWVVTPE
jgi:hypothetical protein